MLIDCDDVIINTDHVRSFERVKNPNPKGSDWRTRAIFPNGESVIVDYAFDDLKRLCGHIVPAPPGYSVVTGYGDSGDGDDAVVFATSPVVAFDVSAPVDLILRPITTEGEPQDPWALIDPTGGVMSSFQRYDDLDAFKRAATKRLLKERAEAKAF